MRNTLMEFPYQIRMTGLPFMMQGWNNVYTKTDEESDGCPVYHLRPYMLYWFIDIIGVTLYRHNGVWVLKRDGEHHDFGINKYGQKPQPDPFGYWTYGAEVKPC